MAAAEFLQRLMEEHGEDFEVRRDDGTTSNARGLRNHEKATKKAYVGFPPGTTLRVGDLLVGTVSKDRLRVLNVVSDFMYGEVLQIKAFSESEESYQQRTARSPASSINIGTMTNSAIQQNSPGAVQSLALTQKHWNDVEEIVTAIVSAIDQLGLSDGDKSDLLADAETIQAQLKKSSPNTSLIRSCLEGVKSGLSKAVTSAASSGASALAKGLIGQIGTFLGG